MDEFVSAMKFASRVKKLAKSDPEAPIQLYPVRQWVEQNPSNPESVKSEKLSDTLSAIPDIPSDAAITSSGSGNSSGNVTPQIVSRSESPIPVEVNRKTITKSKIAAFKHKIGTGYVAHNIPENSQELGKLLEKINALERLITMSAKLTKTKE